MLAEKTFKSRKLYLGRLITAFLNNRDDSIRIKADFIDEMKEVITDLEFNEKGTIDYPIPMEALEWGKDYVVLREKSALDHIHGESDPREEVLSSLATLSDESVKYFVKALTETLTEVYKNAKPTNA